MKKIYALVDVTRGQFCITHSFAYGLTTIQIKKDALSKIGIYSNLKIFQLVPYKND